MGGLLIIVGKVVEHFLDGRMISRREKPRKELLKKMLEDERFPKRWRTLDTLMHVIGANEETTKRLLIEVGARASEDGQNLWGLIKHHPFETISQ